MRAVPALKYALGVLGIVSAIAIIKGFGLDFGVAALGTLVMLILMTCLVVFAALTKVKSSQIRVASLVMMWSFLAASILSAVLLFTSTFFDYPKPIDQIVRRTRTTVNDVTDDGAYEDHPVVDFSYPVQEQVHLLPEDKVRVVAAPPSLKQVRFGWPTPQAFREDRVNPYVVQGKPNKPVIPEFLDEHGQKLREGGVKLEVVFGPKTDELGNDRKVRRDNTQLKK
jgi:hypothetical protein